MLTRLFPSRALPTLGTFCFERAVALAKHADVRVMVPTPWFPRGLPAPAAWHGWARVERDGMIGGLVPATYPRYLSIPRMATSLQGIAMARSARRELASRYDDWRPDVIDGHFAFPDGYASVRLGRELGCPTLVTCHGSDLRLYPALPVAGAMLRWTMRNADRVISVSTALRRQSVDLGCPEDRAVFLTNGVDPNKFTLRDQGECRHALGLATDRPLGVCVANLIDVKNQSLIVRALAEIRRRGLLPPRVAFVGDGPNRSRLEAEVAALNLTQDVIFAGKRPHTEVAVWMGAADWLLLASLHEGWPTVYFEAMACGRPVLTSNVDSAIDAIGKPDYGCVVEAWTPESFAGAMIDACQRHYDAKLIRSYAEAHSWQRWAEQAMAVIEAAVHSCRCPV